MFIKQLNLRERNPCSYRFWPDRVVRFVTQPHRNVLGPGKTMVSVCSPGVPRLPKRMLNCRRTVDSQASATSRTTRKCLRRETYNCERANCSRAKGLPLRRLYVRAFVSCSLPFVIFTPHLCLLPTRNSDPGSHGRHLPPLPATVRAFYFYREKTAALSFLVDSRLTPPTHATRALSAIGSFLQKKSQNVTTEGFELGYQRY